MRRNLTAILILGCALLAFTPLVFALLPGGIRSPVLVWVLLPINILAWFAIIAFLLSEKYLGRSIDRLFGEIGIVPAEGGVDRKVQKLIDETKRQRSAAFEIETQASKRKLGSNLRKIVEIAIRELPVNAAELSLFDSESGRWSQALLVGYPSGFAVQSMLEEAANQGEKTSLTSFERRGDVLIQPLMFSGTLFGALRVELKPNREPAEEDLSVLKLLGTQSALMMIDAKFTDELLRMKEKSEESIRAKTGFLAQLSHEIRGPLGIILNGVELITDGLCGPISDEQKDTLKMVKDSGEHLLDLVNDVLDYAKVEAGKVTPKTQEILLKHLLEDLLSVVRGQAHAKGHQLKLEKLDDRLGILCDKRHARQMLINFLTNAIKYTPDAGTITVKAERYAGNRVKISVSDTGIGIPEDQRSKVFGAFERVDNKYALSQLGTGLGMPLSRKLAEVNNGSVDFESEDGVGSTFWVVLPAAEIAAEAGSENGSGAEEAAKGPVGKSSEVILLVDNDVETRQMLEQYLRHHEFSVLSVGSGAEVLKVLREKRIDLAIIENDLPDLSGEEMVSIIRSNKNSVALPIVLLSAKAFVFDIERFLKLGVDRCLSKPVELSELALTARRLIDETKKEKAAAEAAGVAML